jgi:hypothetical protein
VARIHRSISLAAATLYIAVCATACMHKQHAFATVIAPAAVEEGLRLSLVKVRDTSGPTPTMTVLVENHSAGEVSFAAPGYGAQVFVYLESMQQWVEVTDPIIGISESEDILAPRGEGANWSAVVTARARIPGDIAADSVRLVVTGESYIDSGGTAEVCAYIDVSLR